MRHMKRVIISGYFNPFHTGHLDLVESAGKIGDWVIVIVNNDKQQLLKKGKIILNQDDRVRLVKAVKGIDEVVLSVDQDAPVSKTLRQIAERYPDDELIFGNGGDRASTKDIPETAVCEEMGIEMRFGLAKVADSSTRINQALGYQ